MTPSVAATAVAGRYVIGDSFASGGMGTVHLGRVRGAGGFARTVAVKKLFPGYANDLAFRQMLLDEARLASRIRHPNVVPTLDVWEEQNDLYVVMEYVHGVSLARLLKLAAAAGPIPVPIALGILEGVLSGLHAAHEARAEDGSPLGMVHRDVSPQNILVGADGVARLIDFGIAKAATGLQVTAPGVVKGKTGYMAPEQLLGQRVSRHADVFAAAAVLWEALTNRMLLEEHGDEGLQVRMTTGEDVPPSRYRDSVSSALDAIVLRGLAVTAANRFPTAEAMALAIRQAEVPAASVEVARWVTRAASDELEISEERVRLFEQAPDASSSLPTFSDGPDSDSGITSAVTKPERSGVARTVTSDSFEGPRPAERRHRTIAWGAALLGLGVVGLSYWDHERQTPASGLLRPAAATSPAFPIAMSPALSPTASEAPPPTIPPASSDAARESGSRRAAPSPSTSASAVSDPRGRSSAPYASKPAARKPSCDPPYTMDSNGRKTYDPRCF